MAALPDAQHGCLLWCGRSGRLLWSDCTAATLWSRDSASGHARSWPMPEPLVSFALTGSDDRLLLGLATGLAFFTFSTGRIQRIEAALPPARLSDGRCDRQGRFVFGLSGHGIWRLNLDLGLERLPLEHGATVHGICFSPDGRRMLFADAATGEIRRADYHPCSGEVGAARGFIAADAAPGRPAGAAVDAEGCLWSARRGVGQVLRFAPDGRLERMIDTETARPCALAFGGSNLATLYVAGVGPVPETLFRQAHGLAEPRFLHA